MRSGTMIEEACSRRSCSISRRVRSTASLAPAPKPSMASDSERASISNASGSRPPGVSSCVSPMYRTARLESVLPMLVTGVSTRIVPMRRSVYTSSRYRLEGSIRSCEGSSGVLMGARISAPATNGTGHWAGAELAAHPPRYHGREPPRRAAGHHDDDFLRRGELRHALVAKPAIEQVLEPAGLGAVGPRSQVARRAADRVVEE